MAAHRTQDGKTRVTVIPSGADLERSISSIQARLNKPRKKGE